MKMYLSYGGGVNSTAMLLLLLDKGWGFETVYVDHGCDWPETREYVAMMAERYPITILKPSFVGYDNLYDYCFHYRIIPNRVRRWCTQNFKVQPINDYLEPPCFSLIGISSDEAHRAKISSESGIENRYPLLEYGVDRKGCIEIIQSHGLPVPMKSGCFICPFQRVSQWKSLRRLHPELFCAARRIEELVNEARVEKGKGPVFFNRDRRLDAVVNEKQSVMWGEMKPPCSCGL